jgi:hypothetical protein
MRPIAKSLGLVALIGTALPPALFMLKLLPIEPMKALMLGATVLWFVTAPFWIGRDTA